LALLPLVILPGALGGEAVFLAPKLVWLFVVLVPSALFVVRGAGLQWGSLALPGLLVAWMAVASLFHDDPWRSLLGRPERLDGVLSHLALLVVLAGGAAVAGRSQGDRLLSAIARVGVVVALGSILQRFGVLGALAEQRASFLLVDLPSSTIGNRGYAACYLAAVLPIALHRSLASGRLLWLLGSFICALAIGFGWSRGATLAALVGLGVFVAAARGARKRAAVLAVVALVGLAGGTALSDPGDGSSASRTFSSASSGRTPLYHAAIRGALRHPLFGLGAGGVLTSLQQASPAQVLSWAGVKGTHATTSDLSTVRMLTIDYTAPNGSRQQYVNITTKAHNEVLDYAVSFGVPAAVLASLMFALAIWRARRDVALVSALGAFVAGLMTWPQVMRTAPILWALLGVALASQVRSSDS
jgi:O-antigen ligase